MNDPHEITHVELADRENLFRLDAHSWNDDDSHQENLLVSVEIRTATGTWKSRATAVMSPGIEDVASAAASAARGVAGGGAIDYAAEGEGTALAFSFRFLPANGCVVVTVVVDSGLVPDEPTPSKDGSDTVLLRVLPHEVDAFANALEDLADREPGHLLWVG